MPHSSAMWTALIASSSSTVRKTPARDDAPKLSRETFIPVRPRGLNCIGSSCCHTRTNRHKLDAVESQSLVTPLENLRSGQVHYGVCALTAFIRRYRVLPRLLSSCQLFRRALSTLLALHQGRFDR